MRTVVGYPQFTGLMAAPTGATFDASYPGSNIVDIVNIRRVARAAAAGDISFSIAFSKVVAAQLVTVLHHNAIAGATIEIVLFVSTPLDKASNAAGVLYDVVLTPGAPLAAYPLSTPFLAPAAVSAVGMQVLLAGNGATAWEVGGIDVSAAYLWPDVDTSMTRGYASRSVRNPMPGGIDQPTRLWSPRTAAGRRPLITRAEQEGAALDMQRVFRQSAPFVYVRDIDDAAKWARECFLVKNRPINPLVATTTAGGALSYDFEEHLL